MKKIEASIWYEYMMGNGSRITKGFEEYYAEYKSWFDSNELDPRYSATIAIRAIKDFFAPTTCTSNTVPCQKGNNPMYIDECTAPLQWATTTQSKKSKETNAGAMAINVTTAAPEPVEVGQRRLLVRRAYDVWYAQRQKLVELFFINEPDGPKTAKELKERLAKGLYTITIPKDEDDEEFDEDDYRCFYWQDSFSWRTKDTKPDKVGYKAALENLQKFYQDVLDTIKIVSPLDGLTALKSLQDWKPAKK